MTTDPGYRVLSATEASEEPHEEFATDVLEGLSERPKKLSSRYLYDDSGSDSFQKIMALEDYYPTRCEAEILETHAAAILRRFLGAPLNLVDLGAGDGAKTMILLRHLVAAAADCSFVPIDISQRAMAGLAAIVREQVPATRIAGLVADYWTALRWLGTHSADRRNLVLFLGSNIGNFHKASARKFLRRLWLALNDGDGVFLGFDLKKDLDRLLRAYNDQQGVTAQFNLNLLARINRELDGHFDLAKFRHYATYDVFSGAVESYLVSRTAQSVPIDALGCEFSFDAWEPVHTEYSYKYLDSDIAALAMNTGFEVEDMFYDANGWFAGSLWRVRKRRA